MPSISVIICTHNPRADYLRRVLDALNAQTLCKEQWELLLIDNASKDLLAQSWNLAWHPHARHIREEELGQTYARMRGIKEAGGQFLVFVDDDNVIWPDYLAQVLEFFREHPEAAAVGGASNPQYEHEPPAWLLPLQGALAVGKRDVPTERLSAGTYVWGAGISLRADSLGMLFESGFHFVCCGRSGKQLAAGEDVELCRALQILGWEVWYCDKLQLTHFIPARRCEWSYIRRLFRGNGATSVLLDAYGEDSQAKIAGVRFRWWWRELSLLKQIIRDYGDLFALVTERPGESKRVLRLESQIGRFVTLWKYKHLYQEMLLEVAEWKLKANGIYRKNIEDFDVIRVDAEVH